jgi:hypothetical protein
VRELDRWAGEHAALDFQDLQSGYHSAEIWFERWPRPLPVGIRRRMVQHLVDIHDAWLPQLLEAGEPFYLGIWLFLPELTESQVVAAIEGRADEYAERHDEAHRAPPPQLYQGHPRDLTRFEWTRRRYVDRELLSSFAPGDRPSLLRRADAVERAGGDRLLSFKREAWFARLPTSA